MNVSLHHHHLHHHHYKDMCVDSLHISLSNLPKELGFQTWKKSPDLALFFLGL